MPPMEWFLTGVRNVLIVAGFGMAVWLLSVVWERIKTGRWEWDDD